MAKKIPWQDREFATMQEASELLLCSPAKIYSLIHAGKLSAVRVASQRTGVRVADIKAMLAEAEEWTPGTQTKQATAARQRG